MIYLHATQRDILLSQAFGILLLIGIGLVMYWIVWRLIKKYLLSPLVEKSFEHEAIEEDQKSPDREDNK